MAIDFKLPFLGDGIAAATIVKVLVKPGDRIARGQAVLEVETDKASVEVPSDLEGTVSAVPVQVGAKVTVGQVVMSVEASSAPQSAQQPPTTPVSAAPPTPVTAPGPEQAPAAGTGPAPGQPAPAPARPMRTSPPTAAEPASSTPAPLSPAPAVIRRNLVPASPTVRRLARELGIDITQVPGTGPSGRITIDDVKAFSRRTNIDVGGFLPARALAASTPLPDFAKWGEIEHISMSSVRKKTAEHMAHCWATIPHVTQFDKANIEDLETLRRNYGRKAEAAGGKLTVTAILLKVVASALKVFPQFNASVDPESSALIYKKYINIGVAVDTDRGLLVPVLRNVDRKNIIELSVELNRVAERARTRKTTLEEMQGGTFTITNLGGIGGTAFTPIVNAPEVAILGVARTQVEPIWDGEKFVPHRMLPLALSYDHRIIDGADGARFLRWIVEALEQPFLMSLEG